MKLVKEISALPFFQGQKSIPVDVEIVKDKVFLIKVCVTTGIKCMLGFRFRVSFSQ